MLYLVVTPQWYFNDEWWFTAGGTARKSFLTEAAAQSEAARLNREAIRKGHLFPLFSEHADDVSRIVSEKARLKNTDQVTDEVAAAAFKQMTDEELDSVLEAVDDHLYSVVAVEHPATPATAENWFLLVERYRQEGERDDNDYEKVISVVPTLGEAQQQAIEFNRAALNKDANPLMKNLGAAKWTEAEAQHVRQTLTLADDVDLASLTFPDDGTLNMVRRLADAFSFFYRDVKPCPAMDGME